MMERETMRSVRGRCAPCAETVVKRNKTRLKPFADATECNSLHEMHEASQGRLNANDGHARKCVVLVVPGTPVPKGRPRFARSGHAYTPEATRRAEAAIRALYAQQCGVPDRPDERPVAVAVTAYMPIPKSMPKRLRTLAEEERLEHRVRPDADNLLKLVTDALNGLAWRDDGQIYSAQVRKTYSANPRTVARITYLEEG